VWFVVIYDKSVTINNEEIHEIYVNKQENHKKLFRKCNGSSACLIYGLTWEGNTNEIWAFICTLVADEEHISKFGCHWVDLLLGLT
jgi:hypothetical protein